MSNYINQSLIEKLDKYCVPKSAQELIRNTNIVFLVGVVGAGKDTVIGELLKTGQYHWIVSHTTRPPRYNHGVLEKDGYEYHFVTVEKAEQMLDNKEFIEAKLVHGNIYGTSIAEIQSAYDKSEIAISDLEVQGVAEYKAVADNVLPIFLLPPDFQTWQERLRKRYEGSIDKEELRKRLETARSELKEALSKDYFEYVINRDLNTTISIVDQIAHGQVSANKNDQAREIAQTLLHDINKAL